MGKYKKRIIKFSWLPGSWGLSGHIYKEAEASYYMDGEDLDRALAKIRYYDENRAEYDRRLVEIEYKYKHIDALERDIKLHTLAGTFSEAKRFELECVHGKITEYERDIKLANLEKDKAKLKIALLEVECKHGNIDEYEKDTKIAKLTTDETERELAVLEVDLKHGKLEKVVYEKKRATILEEPWVDIINHGYNREEGVNGMYFELDWNDYWIAYLQLNGYTGPTDEAIVKSWFADVCSNNGADDGLSYSDVFGEEI